MNENIGTTVGNKSMNGRTANMLNQRTVLKLRGHFKITENVYLPYSILNILCMYLKDKTKKLPKLNDSLANNI